MNINLRLLTLAVFGLCVLLSAGCVANPDAFLLNPGVYKDNYIKLIDEEAPFLEHPTGDFPSIEPPTRLAAGYKPEVRDTDDMDRITLDLLEQGYVMIGFSALNSREVSNKPCDLGSMTKAEYDSCRFWTAFGGVNPDADPLGDPIDAGIALNAALVVVQRDYSFSRVETQAQRIVTDEGVDGSATIAGSRNRSRTDAYGSSNTSGYSSTYGSNNAKTNSGGISLSPWSSSKTEGDYDERTYNSSSTNDRSTSITRGGDISGSATGSRTAHWATALVQNTVDHYDFIATFWKKAKPTDMVLGVLTAPLPRELWPVIGSRSARVVRAVVGDTPAYMAEIWEGDVIVAIEGKRIQGENGLRRTLEQHAGEEVTFTIYRGDGLYDLPVNLNRGTTLGNYAAR